jgi:hypothetical protein
VIGPIEISGAEPVVFAKKKLGPGERITLSQEFISGELSVGAKKDGTLIDATVQVVNTKTGVNVAGGRTYTSDKSNPKSFTLEPGTYKVTVRPVRPAGLAAKDFIIEVKSKATAEKLLEW